MDGISQIIMQHLETVNMQQKVNNSRGGAASSRALGRNFLSGPPSNHPIIHETINSLRAKKKQTKKLQQNRTVYLCERKLNILMTE